MGWVRGDGGTLKAAGATDDIARMRSLPVPAHACLSSEQTEARSCGEIATCSQALRIRSGWDISNQGILYEYSWLLTTFSTQVLV